MNYFCPTNLDYTIHCQARYVPVTAEPPDIDTGNYASNDANADAGTIFMAHFLHLPRIGEPVPLRKSLVHMRILFVEDNRGLADAFAALASYLGHDPDVAYDGQTALLLASTTLYDAIFLDIGLPDMDGGTLCLRLRSASENAQTTVVAITGRANLSESEIAPFDGYLLKPVTRETLEAVIAGC